MQRVCRYVRAACFSMKPTKERPESGMLEVYIAVDACKTLDDQVVVKPGHPFQPPDNLRCHHALRRRATPTAITRVIVWKGGDI